LGVYGQASDTGGAGVYGTNTIGTGVLGSTTAGQHYGVEGENSNGIGVYGEGITGLSGHGSDLGVYGQTSNASGLAVSGINNDGTAIAGTSSANGYYGVEGMNANSNGTGVYGVNTAAAGNGTGYGVWGKTSQQNGLSGGGFGVFAENTNSSGGGLDAYNDGSGIYTVLAQGSSGLTSSGTKSTVVEDQDGNSHLMYCDESPEVLFHDYGSGTLVNGEIHIDLDPLYARNVAIDAKHPLRVLITLEGDCNGIYVTNKTATGFDVVELKGGNSDVEFTYEVIANRVNKTLANGEVAKYSDMRFPDFTPPTHPVQTANIDKK
jgi:hypothetical protein